MFISLRVSVTVTKPEAGGRDTDGPVVGLRVCRKRKNRGLWPGPEAARANAHSLWLPPHTPDSGSLWQTLRICAFHSRVMPVVLGQERLQRGIGVECPLLHSLTLSKILVLVMGAQ